MRNKKTLCPCQSCKPYETCCKPFHLGKNPDTALQLMRSRYAAYALCMPNYIIQTTHPKNPQFNDNTKEWIQEISTFSSHMQFKDLKILEVQENREFATVAFFAHLFQGKKDASFIEKSYFEKVEGKWLYRNGEFIS